MIEGLNVISKEIYEANKAKGFWDKERNVGETLMLVVTELAEAMEAHRGKGRKLDRETFERFIPISYSVPKDIEEKSFKFYFEDNIKDTFEDEIADAMIRIFDMAGGLNIDLEFHIENKLKYNATRERLHGKKY
ncbi:pyrophosphatase [Cellulophaga phage phi14:2]|uniref:Nucleoside triphosphate pyrophosphohydrolase, MazG n=1 Tax=Cellulophaga phage phi14:2 TaxID=1327990 RepID=S0A3B9_9CAUD|nr:pyrophosphatase [Cellulophaga phage phi14:2]AGO48937.1 nucleoside triphosphate pyrophosphohydrolase, MazG [Cellulophaga phage phi14:2]